MDGAEDRSEHAPGRDDADERPHRVVEQLLPAAREALAQEELDHGAAVERRQRQQVEHEQHQVEREEDREHGRETVGAHRGRAGSTRREKLAISGCR